MVHAMVLAAVLMPPPTEFFGKDVGVRLERAVDGTLLETLYGADAKGKMRLILATPTRPGLPVPGVAAKNPLLQQGSTGLFSAAPSFGFSEVAIKPDDRGATIVLTANGNGYKIVKELRIPKVGQYIQSTVRCQFQTASPVIRYLLDTYAFAPDGKSMSKGGKPDSTFVPAIRPRDDGVIGDHFFRAPVVTVQKGELSASIMPDLDVLKENRYIPTIMDLDCKSGVVDAPLMSYGFAQSRLVGHVYFANDSSMTMPAPPELVLSQEILLDAQSVPFGAYQKAAHHQWNRYGHSYLDKILPQAMPFEEYAKVCIPADFNEKETGGWFETEIDGQICGGMPSGWGRDRGWVSWQPWFNQLRSAWGLRWWGKKLGEKLWVERADKMLNLALAAPMDNGACPTTYMSKEKAWKGTLISPDPKCYYDLTNMAWKGIWLLRWLELDDCPRKEEVEKQVSDMIRYMMSVQNKDGSFPTWTTKDHKVVPILDRSAQSALPAWFFAEAMKEFRDETRASVLYTKDLKSYRPGSALRDQMAESLRRSAEFLIKNIVDQQRYYDFETFFSCSPKQCMQVSQTIDDAAMHDPHTMSPPQNTLCMHWTAEALMSVSLLLGETKELNDLSGRAKTASLKALDIMSLYQNVWPISYRKVAYTYGGFGVQNTDGEYNDARQAQFGDTMADFGAELGRQDYFERGVAAIRASMALINHPLHEKFGIYPNPNYPLGLQPENDGHGGSDHQAGRTGPDWGELSGLTSMAWLLDKYGPSYTVKGGGKVVVDGGTPKIDLNQTSLTNPVFDMTNWRMPGWEFNGDFLHWPVKNPRRFNWNNDNLPFIGTCEDGRAGFEDNFQGEILSPWFKTTKSKIKLNVGGGAGEGVRVELIADPINQNETKPEVVMVARGRNSEQMDPVTWDVSRFQGRRFRIRIIDRETGGWGHINVGNIRCVD